MAPSQRFDVGQVVWVKDRGFPFWPAEITEVDEGASKHLVYTAVTRVKHGEYRHGKYKEQDIRAWREPKRPRKSLPWELGPHVYGDDWQAAFAAGYAEAESHYLDNWWEHSAQRKEGRGGNYAAVHMRRADFARSRGDQVGVD